jgi:hypothetical protein
VIWATLWRSWDARHWRKIATLPGHLFIMLLPIGIFSGARSFALAAH